MNLTDLTGQRERDEYLSNALWGLDRHEIPSRVEMPCGCVARRIRDKEWQWTLCEEHAEEA